MNDFLQQYGDMILEKTRDHLILALLAGFAILAILLIASLLSETGTDNSKLTAGFTAEFLDRPDGYPGLKQAYKLEFAEAPKQMDPGLMYKACADGAVDIICAFATDGRIAAYDLKTLEDDKKFFPPYFAAPLVRSDTLEEHPEIRSVLNRLAGKISDKDMREMNLKVDRENNPMEADQVAREFLLQENLISADKNTAENKGDIITIGGKDFTEQLILGEIMAQIIEHDTNLRVERKLFLGGTMICFNALRSGDLDMYAEYTGTGLVNILDETAISDPKKTFSVVKKQFSEQFDIQWLEPFGFNNTYTITMRREQAESLKIMKISDLNPVAP
jgi:osmoprotectant transport system permease protein